MTASLPGVYTPGSQLTIERGDRIVVTGAAGFIGSAVVRALLARGAAVVALVEPGGNERNLEGLTVERVAVDVRDAAAVTAACADARFIFHLAAIYRFWAKRPRDFYDVNVGGVLNVLEAARRGGCERVVYTSTVGVIGLDGAAHGQAADETCYADVAHLFGLYKRTKYVAEHEVLRAAAQGAPVSLVLPTFPLGPGDARPTPTGKLVTEFLNGRVMMARIASTGLHANQRSVVLPGGVLVERFKENARRQSLPFELVGARNQ